MVEKYGGRVINERHAEHGTAADALALAAEL
jgi:hypothetical protein